MGGGSYSYSSAKLRSVSYASSSREQIFKSNSMFKEMDVKGLIRECCETDEHPNTVPVIIGLDVTGSMGYVPEAIIKKHLPNIVKALQDSGIEHPEICFCAVGDDVYDEAPIQVGQFESSDDLIEKWLTHCWIEQGGGGNNGESYCLVHYFATYHTKCDAFKRGQKGIIITIGDERFLPHSSKHTIKNLFGDDVEKDVEFNETINKCSENWEIFHINIDDYSSRYQRSEEQWKQLLGEDNVKTISGDSDLTELVPTIVSFVSKVKLVKGKTIIADGVNTATTEPVIML